MFPSSSGGIVVVSLGVETAREGVTGIRSCCIWPLYTQLWVYLGVWCARVGFSPLAKEIYFPM